MLFIAACRLSGMESNPARGSRFRAVVRSVASVTAPLPRSGAGPIRSLLKNPAVSAKIEQLPS